MSDALQPHRLQHARPPCPSPTPGVCTNSSPLSWWCHPTIFNSQGSFPLGLTDLILLSKGLSRVFSSTIVQKCPFFSAQPYLWSNFHIYTWLLEKNIALTIRTFLGKVMSLLFKMLSKFDIAILPRHFLAWKCFLVHGVLYTKVI